MSDELAVRAESAAPATRVSDSDYPRFTFEIGAEERALLVGDLGALKPEQRASLVVKICESVGLNPLTRPFEYIVLNGKLTLYARKDATEQLRRTHNVSLDIVARENLEGVFMVTSRATMPSGRHDESIGAVPIAGLRGEALANALMKAETKSKRRVTLSICGLGMLDELELETIPPGAIQQVNDSKSEPAPQEQQTRLIGLPSDLIIEIRAMTKVLGGDEAGLQKAVHAASQGVTETLENLTVTQGEKLLRVLRGKLALRESQSAKVEPKTCPACGAGAEATGVVEDHIWKNGPCDLDTSARATEYRRILLQKADELPLDDDELALETAPF